MASDPRDAGDSSQEHTQPVLPLRDLGGARGPVARVGGRVEVKADGPLAVSSLTWRDASGRLFCTLVAKVGHELAPGLCPLLPEPIPIQHEDGHWENDPQKSVHVPSDLAPFKAAAEIVVVGSAFAPVGPPQQSVIARVIAGSVDKSVVAWAPRFQRPDGSIEELPRQMRFSLRYERAAGGPETDNPAGIDTSRIDTRGRRQVPELLPPNFELKRPGDFVPTIGLGPIAAAWRPRMGYLGDQDAEWLRGSREIAQPAGFPPRFFQAAPMDQWLDRPLVANERIVLEGLHASIPRLVTSLSGIEPWAVVGVTSEPLRMQADLLFIDTDRALATLTFRAQVPLDESGGRLRVVILGVPMGAPPPADAVRRARSVTVGAPAPNASPVDTQPWHETTRVEDAGPRKPAVLPFPAGGAPAKPAAMFQTSTALARPPLASQPDGALPFAPPPRASFPDGSLPFAAPPSRASSPDLGLPFPSTPPPAFTPPLSQPPQLPPRASQPPQMTPAPPPLVPPPSLLSTPASVPPLPPPPPMVPAAMIAETPVFVPPVATKSALPPVPADAREPQRGALIRPLTALRSDAGTPSATTPATPANAALGGLQSASDAAAAREREAKTASAPRERTEPRSPPRRAVVDLLAFDPPIAPRLRALQRFASIWPRPRAQSIDDARRDPPDRDRETVLRVLCFGRPEGAHEIRRALADGLDDADLDPPLALVSGELKLIFDETETLRVTVAVAQPVAGGDKKVLAAIALAQEALGTTIGPRPDAALSLARQIESATASLSLPPRYVAAEVERALLEGRKLKRRTLRGAARVRADLVLRDGEALPIYLPDTISGSLPLLPAFPILGVCEVRPREDGAEAHAEALFATALGRVLHTRAES
ncbi:D-alanyl-D-alanine carboxypeptidase [Minicystis rosea]|nr:D-alanyl-D-alanine carboxypeptidase [Minicystis rosea]